MQNIAKGGFELPKAKETRNSTIGHTQLVRKKFLVTSHKVWAIEMCDTKGTRK